MRFRVLYVDPPWEYEDEAHAGERGVIYKYPPMEDEEIIALPMQDIAADDAFLFMWITWPKLFLAETVMKAWGFEYKTCGFLWAKTNTVQTWTPFWGMGSYTRANTEPCLLGVRGKPRRTSKRVHQLVEAPIGEHSEKPAAVRNRIVEFAGRQVPKVEVFARQRHRGWTVMGNAIDGLDIREAIPRMAKKLIWRRGLTNAQKGVNS